TDANVLADKTKPVSDGLETVLTTPETGTSNAAKPSEEIKFGEIKLGDLVKLVPNVKADFKDLDSLEDDPIIVVDDSEEDEKEDKNEEIHSTTNDETEDISDSTPPSPSSLPTELKELSLMFNELTDEVKALKTQVYGLETEVPGDLKDLPTKLEEFTTTVTSLTSQVAEIEDSVGTASRISFSTKSATSKSGDQCVPLASQASSMLVEGEKNTNQATIS
ncbi:hypothetical protein Tco_1443499, partial [Tanacetum coccineum]